MYGFEVIPEAIRSTLLWGDIEEACKWMASGKVSEQALSLLIGCCSVDCAGFNVCGS
jgi:hypothetical protein